LQQSQKPNDLQISLTTGVVTRRGRQSSREMASNDRRNLDIDFSAFHTDSNEEESPNLDDELFQRERDRRSEEDNPEEPTDDGDEQRVINANLYDQFRREQTAHYNANVAPPINIPVVTSAAVSRMTTSTSQASSGMRIPIRSNTWSASTSTNTMGRNNATTQGIPILNTSARAFSRGGSTRLTSASSMPRMTTYGNQPVGFTQAQMDQMTQVVTQVFTQYHQEVSLPIQQHQSRMGQDMVTLGREMGNVTHAVHQMQANLRASIQASTANTTGQGHSRGRGIPNSGNYGFQMFQPPTIEPQEMLDAIRSIRYSNSTKTPVPKFNMKKTTAVEYLQEVEAYYEITNVHPDRFLYLVTTILPEQVKLWWDHHKASVRTWQEFRALFISKYDTSSGANERMRILQTRQQRKTESVERFIYEMIKMSKIVYPQEPIQQALDRTRNALFHRLRVGLGAQVITTPEALLEAVSTIHAGLLAQDRAMNVKSDLPPITETEDSSKNKNNWKDKHENTSDQTTSQRSGIRGRSSNFRSRSRSFQRGGRSSYGRGQSSNNSSNEQERQSQRNSEQSTSSRPSSSQSNSKPKGNEGLANIQCLKCRGFGHLTKQCPNKRGVALVAVEGSQSQDPGNENEDVHDQSLDSEDLNE